MRTILPLFNTQKAWMISGLLVLCLVVFSLPALAQSRDVDNRLKRLENEIQTLSRTVYRGEAPRVSSYSGDTQGSANAEVRMQQLEVELRDLRGKMEEQAYEIRQLRTQLERTLSDVELRMGDLEQPSGAGRIKTMPTATPRYTASSTSPTPRPMPPPPTQGSDFSWNSNPSSTQPAAGGQLGTITRSGTTGAVTASTGDAAASSYENAFALLKNSQYDAAERAFQGFLDQNPGHSLSSNAQYWLGETFYVRGKFERAARVFAEGYKLYPQSSKAPDNLLKLGMSLAGLGNKDDACVALGQLEKEFPTGSLPVLRRAKQEMSRLNCV